MKKILAFYSINNVLLTATFSNLSVDLFVPQGLGNIENV